MKTAEYLPLSFYLHPLTLQLGLLIETTVLVQIVTGHTLNTKIPGAICDYRTFRITSGSSGENLEEKLGIHVRGRHLVGWVWIFLSTSGFVVLISR